MTRHTRYAVTYGAVVALASALVAPSAAFAAPDATGGEVTPAAQQRPQAAQQGAGLDVNQLNAAPPAQQKQMLGEALYPKIHEMQPELAGKITGMLLEMDNSELINL